MAVPEAPNGILLQGWVAVAGKQFSFPTTAISVFPKRIPKVCRKAFGTIKMSLGKSACFRVPFTCPWIGGPGSLVRKASANIQECPDLSRRLLKCSRRCHWSFCRGPHVRSFTSDCRVTNSNLSFGRESLCREPVGQNGVLIACPSLVECSIRGWGERASARACHEIATWLRGVDYETVDEGLEPAKRYMQGRSPWKAIRY
ncbi:hypothetical protein CRG98_016099 [Punica granatum]|uniref:Uncharacterized protein n=1 Tax=Punica granatum TaxID=22663 RepID=A0A2I0K4H0_PUNGR|nr:hypothetical protein CRG98_016099 [Punica granatum]